MTNTGIFALGDRPADRGMPRGNCALILPLSEPQRTPRANPAHDTLVRYGRLAQFNLVPAPIETGLVLASRFLPGLRTAIRSRARTRACTRSSSAC